LVKQTTRISKMPLSRLYDQKDAVFTPAQNQPVTPAANTGGALGQTWNGGRNAGYTNMGANRMATGGVVGNPKQATFSGMTQQYYDDLKGQQANNAAAYGYDASGNWGLLNGGADFTDTYGRANPYQSVIDQYGMRPTGYEGANSGRINTTGDRGLPYSASNPGGYQPTTETRPGTPAVTPITSAPPSSGAPLPGTPPPVVETTEEYNKRMGKGGLGMKRGDAQAYGGAAQYNPYTSQNQSAESYGGLGYSSAQGNRWGHGGGRSWNQAIWD
jgi:hypothetical protein